MRLNIISRSIVWQLVILVAVTAVIFHVCIGFTFYIARSAKLAPPAESVIAPIIDLADAADPLTAERQRALVARFAANHRHLHAAVLASGEASPNLGPADSSLVRLLRPRLPAGSSVSTRRDDSLVLRTREGILISLSPDGQLVGPPQLIDLVFATTLFVTLSATLFLVWGIRNIAIPLATFAKVADRFALDERDEPLSEDGSAEVRLASRAFNRMQARIRSMVADRTRMLAAIGHDLRTPITRIRLRAEYIPDVVLKQAITRDLEEMDGLVHNALSFLRNSCNNRNKQALDIGSLLQSVCDDFTDTGGPVSFEGPLHVKITAYSDDIRRMFSNIIGNAILHGKHVSVMLREPEHSLVEIDVCDDGPGMTDVEKLQAFEPFWRGAQSRVDQRGFGLGLSIVRAISDAHGGRVTLLDAPAGGLVCRIQLPA